MTLRPVIRRWDPNDLETARRVVSRAERRALDRAEEYSRMAEDLLRAAVSPEDPAAEPDPPVAAAPERRVEAVRAHQADPPEPGSAEPGGPAQITEEAVRLLGEAAQQAEDVLEAALAAAAEAQEARRDADTEAERIRADARADAVAIVDAARAEVDASRSIRDELASEMLTLRAAMERTKASFEAFLASSELAAGCSAEPAVEVDPSRS